MVRRTWALPPEKEITFMKTTLAAVTALAGSLLLAPFMLGPTQAGSAPDLKNGVGTTHAGAVTLIRGGGGGGGHGGGHMSVGGSAGGRAGTQASASRRYVGAQASTGRRYTSQSRSASHWNGNRSNNRHFANGGYYYGGYGTDNYDDCYSLRRYSWARYEACIGVY
jgi:hypothetical protein